MSDKKTIQKFAEEIRKQDLGSHPGIPLQSIEMKIAKETLEPIAGGIQQIYHPEYNHGYAAYKGPYAYISRQSLVLSQKEKQENIDEYMNSKLRETKIAEEFKKQDLGPPPGIPLQSIEMEIAKKTLEPMAGGIQQIYDSKDNSDSAAYKGPYASTQTLVLPQKEKQENIDEYMNSKLRETKIAEEFKKQDLGPPPGIPLQSIEMEIAKKTLEPMAGGIQQIYDSKDNYDYAAYKGPYASTQTLVLPQKEKQENIDKYMNSSLRETKISEKLRKQGLRPPPGIPLKSAEVEITKVTLEQMAGGIQQIYDPEDDNNYAYQGSYVSRQSLVFPSKEKQENIDEYMNSLLREIPATIATGSLRNWIEMLRRLSETCQYPDHRSFWQIRFLDINALLNLKCNQRVVEILEMLSKDVMKAQGYLDGYFKAIEDQKHREKQKTVDDLEKLLNAQNASHLMLLRETSTHQKETIQFLNQIKTASNIIADFRSVIAQLQLQTNRLEILSRTPTSPATNAAASVASTPSTPRSTLVYELSEDGIYFNAYAQIEISDGYLTYVTPKMPTCTFLNRMLEWPIAGWKLVLNLDLPKLIKRIASKQNEFEEIARFTTGEGPQLTRLLDGIPRKQYQWLRKASSS
ncbi:uncharacterized protein LOC105199630 isoform X2 [Solenopsis invicta]|nr:uncharacterized protein LOC105199630 isoform X2 [Solenopsis invicta]XP_039308433.1 uncharacterized protein LOC105199630 isoform X2 [Solenopsis invicta]XP_039308434.1 uncharacterized protein LOC105199630 isoform X2 [Solenopsis invicta]XP_039308435.1 uncharacterized protein LOC105199630 isoform X2 [Solenopsis invicta]XP_039308436.1 uncharacterized protein LOC105199630 isoform X2 [Solenopsis invicta]XP_039308437.1 uncharacterized protein LOC105199630 isoform X2 [Solenopsis invicta]XP_03930843